MSAGCRLGFAVKVLGGGGLAASETRRWQNGPHLSRSIKLLNGVFDHLARNEIHVYRMSSSVVPYGTHPDLSELGYARQIDRCAGALDALRARAQRRPAPLDAPRAVHGAERAGRRRRRQGARRHRAGRAPDVLELHAHTGVRVIYDHHHHRCHAAPGLERPTEALAAALRTWPPEVRPTCISRAPERGFAPSAGETRAAGPARRCCRRAPQHSDFVTPWDLAELLDPADRPLDVMLEARAKNLALLELRRQLRRLLPALAAREERRLPRAQRLSSASAAR